MGFPLILRFFSLVCSCSAKFRFGCASDRILPGFTEFFSSVSVVVERVPPHHNDFLSGYKKEKEKFHHFPAVFFLSSFLVGSSVAFCRVFLSFFFVFIILFFFAVEFQRPPSNSDAVLHHQKRPASEARQ